jgi:hypothetical protein
MESGAVCRRLDQTPNFASARTLNTERPASTSASPLNPSSDWGAASLGNWLKNSHCSQLFHAESSRFRPTFLPGSTLRVEIAVNHSKQSSVTQSTRGQNRLLRPAKTGKTSRRTFLIENFQPSCKPVRSALSSKIRKIGDCLRG